MRKWLLIILRALFGAIIEVIIRRSKPSVEDGKKRTKLRDRLRASIRRRFPPTLSLFFAVCFMGSLSVGCVATRTVYISNGEPVRLRERVPKAKVWVADKDGEEIPGVVDLPEGWYCLPMPEGE